MPWNIAGNIKGPKGDKGDPGNAGDIAALIHAAASKTPVDADELPLLDSAGSWGLRKFTLASLKSTLQSLFFYRGNILGTVSQSGGIPTGAIIQRGSNANGDWVRLADGTQLCQVIFTGYTANVARSVTFPAAFSSSVIGVGLSVDANVGWDTDTTFSVASASDGAFYSKNTYNNTVRIILTGKWF